MRALRLRLVALLPFVLFGLAARVVAQEPADDGDADDAPELDGEDYGWTGYAESYEDPAPFALRAACSGGRCVAVGPNGVWYAEVGERLDPVPALGAPVHAVALLDDVLVLGDDAGLFTVPLDGAWQGARVATAAPVRALASADGVVLAFDAEGHGWRRDAAGTWERTAELGARVTALARGRGTWAAVGGDNAARVWLSYDGREWLDLANDSTDGALDWRAHAPLRDVVGGREGFLAVSDANRLLASHDGRTWIALDLAWDATLDLAALDGLGFALGRAPQWQQSAWVLAPSGARLELRGMYGDPSLDGLASTGARIDLLHGGLDGELYRRPLSDGLDEAPLLHAPAESSDAVRDDVLALARLALELAPHEVQAATPLAEALLAYGAPERWRLAASDAAAAELDARADSHLARAEAALWDDGGLVEPEGGDRFAVARDEALASLALAPSGRALCVLALADHASGVRRGVERSLYKALTPEHYLRLARYCAAASALDAELDLARVWERWYRRLGSDAANGVDWRVEGVLFDTQRLAAGLPGLETLHAALAGELERLRQDQAQVFDHEAVEALGVSLLATRPRPASVVELPRPAGLTRLDVETDFDAFVDTGDGLLGVGTAGLFRSRDGQTYEPYWSPPVGVPRPQRGSVRAAGRTWLWSYGDRLYTLLDAPLETFRMVRDFRGLGLRAVGTDGRTLVVAHDGRRLSYTSDAGDTWREVELPGYGALEVASLTHGAGRWLVLLAEADSGESCVASSTDLADWQVAPLTTSDRAPRDVVFACGRFVAGGQPYYGDGAPCRLLASDDGFLWEPMVLPGTSAGLLRVLGGRFYLFDTTQVLSSLDGRDWRRVGEYPPLHPTCAALVGGALLVHGPPNTFVEYAGERARLYALPTWSDADLASAPAAPVERYRAPALRALEAFERRVHADPVIYGLGGDAADLLRALDGEADARVFAACYQAALELVEERCGATGFLRLAVQSPTSAWALRDPRSFLTQERNELLRLQASQPYAAPDEREAGRVLLDCRWPEAERRRDTTGVALDPALETLRARVLAGDAAAALELALAWWDGRRAPRDVDLSRYYLELAKALDADATEARTSELAVQRADWLTAMLAPPPAPTEPPPPPPQQVWADGTLLGEPSPGGGFRVCVQVQGFNADGTYPVNRLSQVGFEHQLAFGSEVEHAGMWFPTTMTFEELSTYAPPPVRYVSCPSCFGFAHTFRHSGNTYLTIGSDAVGRTTYGVSHTDDWTEPCYACGSTGWVPAKP